MIKSKKLEKLCIILAEYPAKWDKIVDRFVSHKEFDEKNIFSIKEYSKYFSEIHLELILHEIAVQNNDLNLSFEPFNKVIDTSDYKFRYDQAGRLFAKSKKGITNYEYDNIIMVDKLMVDFEITISDYTYWKRENGKKVETDGFRRDLRYGVYFKRLHPLRQFFRDDVGFVMIVPKNGYNKIIDVKDTIVQNFQKEDGILVPLYTNKGEFRNDVIDAVKVNGLRYTKNDNGRH